MKNKKYDFTGLTINEIAWVMAKRPDCPIDLNEID